MKSPWTVSSRALVILAALSSTALADGPKVTLVPAKPTPTYARESVTGQLGPSKMLPLGFEVGGRLTVSRVVKGQSVKAGQALGNLDTEIINAQVAQAEAGVMAAEAQSSMAEDMAGRNEKLKAEGSISDVQSKQTGAQAKAAMAQLAQAKAALAQAKAGQRRHYLTAPFAATVTDAPDNTGNMVGPGVPVFTLMQLDTLTLKATVPENIRTQLKPGQKVSVEAVGSSARTQAAVLKTIVPSADPQSRRVPIEIQVPNADGQFIANTLARVSIPLGETKAAVVIPATALGTSGGEHVLTVSSSGLVQRVGVTVLERAGSAVTVLAEREVSQVVDYPTPALTEGTKVGLR